MSFAVMLRAYANPPRMLLAKTGYSFAGFAPSEKRLSVMLFEPEIVTFAIKSTIHTSRWIRDDG